MRSYQENYQENYQEKPENQSNRKAHSRAGAEMRSGVTLVELLVVVGLIGFLAGMVTFALRGAQHDARVAHTRSTITKLNDVILQQWEEYRYRAVDLRMDTLVYTPMPNQPLRLARIQAHMRMLVLRDTMRMEMPDRVTDLLFAPSQYVVSSEIDSNYTGAFLDERAYPNKFGLMYGSLYRAVLASTNEQIMNMRTNYPILPPDLVGTGGAESSVGEPTSFFNGGTSAVAVAAWNTEIQSSELLYLIVANATFGGTSALENFRPSEIGDPDDDGLLEFIDAWGNPIQWIRWPAGYPSDLIRYAETDAMDPLRTDWRFESANAGWLSAQNSPVNLGENQPRTLVPLIYSWGRDEADGLIFPSNPVVYALMRQGYGSNRYYIDPFFTMDGLPPFYVDQNQNIVQRPNQLGSVIDEGATDNITNHDIILGL